MAWWRERVKTRDENLKAQRGAENALLRYLGAAIPVVVYSLNMGTCSWSSGRRRRRWVAPMTARTVRESTAVLGWIDQESLGQLLREVLGHETLKDFVVLELDADPESLGAGAAGEGLAGERFRVTEFANEVDAFDLPEVNADDIAGGVEKFELALLNEGGRDISGDGVAIHLADDNLFVG